MGRGLIEMLPVGFIFSHGMNHKTYINAAIKHAENGDIETATDCMKKTIQSAYDEYKLMIINVNHVVYALMNDGKPIPAAQLYIKHFESQTESLHTLSTNNLYELAEGNKEKHTTATCEYIKSQATISMLIKRLTKPNETDTPEEKSKKLGLAKQLLDILKIGNPLVEAKKQINEYASAELNATKPN